MRVDLCWALVLGAWGCGLAEFELRLITIGTRGWLLPGTTGTARYNGEWAIQKALAMGLQLTT